MLQGLALIVVLGIGAQWLAWRFKMPSILLLLVFGFLAGPITGLLDPNALFGEELIFAFVSLSVGIILFEGGLNLKLSELRQVGKAVRNLILIGGLVTWVLATLAAYYLAGFNLELSILMGAILIVTGPTVIVPLLRYVRPTGRVGATAKWEGIMNDPIGAILAVLTLEAVLLMHKVGVDESIGSALGHALEGLFLEFFVGVGVSITGVLVLVLLLRRRLVPDYLLNPTALMVVVGAFVLSNQLQEESGLLTTTFMGILLANQKYVSIQRIVEFKEDLQVLLIGSLFIILSAQLEIEVVQRLNMGSILFLIALMLIVRPVSVFFSSFGTELNRKESVFLSWLAPRGIVAAAVTSLFSFRIRDLYPDQAADMVPLIFLVIVGTVSVYGLSIAPLARRLGLAHPNPQGLLMVGAHAWARKIGKILQEHGFQVLMIDANINYVRKARAEGLKAEHANILSEVLIDELDLGGFGRLLALTPNNEVNALAALHFAEVFDSTNVYQLAAQTDEALEGEGELPQHLRGQPLFGTEATYLALTEQFDRGATLQTLELSETLTEETFQKQYKDALPLFLITAPGKLEVISQRTQVVPEPGRQLIALVGPDTEEKEGE